LCQAAEALTCCHLADCCRTLLIQPSTRGQDDWQRVCVQIDNILNTYC